MLNFYAGLVSLVCELGACTPTRKKGRGNVDFRAQQSWIRNGGTCHAKWVTCWE